MDLIRKLFVMSMVVFISLSMLLLYSTTLYGNGLNTKLIVRLHKGLYAYNRVPETPMPILFKKDFNKLPQWDFEDVYNKDPNFRQTSCPQTILHTDDPGFKKFFIPDINLYLNREDMNVKEWNRLSHFNNPFGFMQFNYTEMKEALDLIPKPTVPLLSPRPGSNGCIRCAVVATGGILNGSRKGQEIDKHDYVFRMNGALIKGYEEDVGNKTSVYVHTAHSLTASLDMFKQYGSTHIPNDEGIKYVMIPEGERDFQWLQGLLAGKKVPTGPYKNKDARNYYSGQFNETRFYVLHPDFLRYVRNRFLVSYKLNQTIWAMARPTNGAFTLFLALHTCDEVSAYGFLTEDHAKYHNYYFERNNRTKVIFYQNHDYALEMMTWKRLHNSKIIHLYQRQEEMKKENPTAHSTH